MTQGAGQGPDAWQHAHPGSAAPEVASQDDGYTPTERNIPVVGTPAAPTPTLVDTPVPAPVPAPAAGEPAAPGPLFVVGDVHGYLDELRAALFEAGLVDQAGHWAAGNSRLWFLGDFTDRGPDGIGVIDLVMQLSAEAAAAGGYCKALLGNHELLILGAQRFGDTPVNSGAGTASFQAAWLLNGGQRGDMERLQDHHIRWMARLDAMAVEDGHLLLHSDCAAYLEYGDTIEAVNDAITAALDERDPDVTWDLFRKFTKRFAFRDEAGPQTARELLDTFGGHRVVHGHSPIPYLLGEVAGEESDGEGGVQVNGPYVYADQLAIAMDGGVTMAGKLLIAQLPLVTEPRNTVPAA
ncbi:metallophosphoesterase [Streptomyces alkaliterrae]|uniref:Metallophosphoesterase n=1 Tax=Streptomyces alkaliterrae TaxID=2213162 RepID=A0A5P0YZJ7_9ACTN|nr:metallophosphoesterase [Streptomyces alkaliterrae]MBB1256719.1 metallophosphoesterase [Streptomyces alkaliterrae]MBB1257683.1 metallophosphoesterase [Streptomyces alkaliterrae]MQS05087.1 serine/threonine protein phosphatase [Streptomyces alkaliterrae]